MKAYLMTVSFILITAFSQLSLAEDFYRLDPALPSAPNIESIAPVFDFDTDGCLPSAGISRTGKQNGGLNPSGGLTSGCRSSNFLESSNLLHRFSCVQSGGSTYCGHIFAIYFEKDQILNFFGGGHRHDWEHAVIFTTDGSVTHGTYSAHGDAFTQPVSELPLQGNHIQFVYHKDGITTHALRFASAGEQAENPYGSFVTPVISSWDQMQGEGVSNSQMRSLLNSFDYGSANLPIKDGNFISNLNEAKPSSYPQF